MFKNELSAQCADYSSHLSPKTANYTIKATLDHEAKLARCNQTVWWHNTSPDTIKELRWYMYMNAFKHPNTTFLKGSTGAFGLALKDKKKEEWGWIEVHQINDATGNNLAEYMQYIQPNDNNPKDESVLLVPLKESILPNDSIRIEMSFEVKLPKTIVRSGYGRDDFFLFVHWFPQLGVYEQNDEGIWGWNCHQFFRRTEFYANFGDYDVTLDVPDHLVIGATGCQIDQKEKDGRTIYTFDADDVIDFAWVAYPHYAVHRSQYKGVEVEILMPPEHNAFVNRYRDALTKAMAYMEMHVGPYPYPKITVVDPPVHTLRSGFMEYPMLITCASFYGIPSGVRTVESLVIHEFVHQYFMAVVATNEKEDAWMDEGFVTYFEDRILDHYYGDQESLISLGPLHSGNAENSRLEYTSYEGRSAQPIALPGWERTGAFKPIVYSKTATVLKTMEGIIGRSNMDEVIKTYYQRWAFKHPKEHDFIALVKEMVEQLNLNFQVDEFFNQCLHGTEEIDYYVEDLGNGNFKIDNYGHLTIPTIIEVTYPNGSQEVISWDGDRPMTWSTKQPIKSITVDPEQAIYLDVNLLNNTWTSKSNPWTSASYASKFGLFLQKTVKWMGVLW